MQKFLSFARSEAFIKISILHHYVYLFMIFLAMVNFSSLLSLELRLNYAKIFKFRPIRGFYKNLNFTSLCLFVYDISCYG